jgi:hypothetical protein
MCCILRISTSHASYDAELITTCHNYRNGIVKACALLRSAAVLMLVLRDTLAGLLACIQCYTASRASGAMYVRHHLNYASTLHIRRTCTVLRMIAPWSRDAPHLHGLTGTENGVLHVLHPRRTVGPQLSIALNHTHTVAFSSYSALSLSESQGSLTLAARGLRSVALSDRLPTYALAKRE